MKKNYFSPAIETTDIHFASVLCDSGADDSLKTEMDNAFGAPKRPRVF
ncbi:MAG: hypothetical protein J6M55_06950 [Paludibacteraceae bacterium]|nr:hypothetical protein [Paludibacteraceae bacterium]